MARLRPPNTGRFSYFHILQSSEVFALTLPLNAIALFQPIWTPLSTRLQTVGPSTKLQTLHKFVQEI